jgi:hypothetical protein
VLLHLPSPTEHIVTKTISNNTSNSFSQLRIDKRYRTHRLCFKFFKGDWLT